MKKPLSVLSLVVLCLSLAVPAFAVPVLDFTAIGTTITGELSPAIVAAMPIAGILLAASIGWKLYKRFCK